MNFDNAISILTDRSQKKGLKFEAYFFSSSVLKLESEDGSISNYVNAETSGLNLRLFDGKRVSFSYCLGTEDLKIEETFENAASLLGLMDDDEYFSFAGAGETASPDVTPESLGIYSDEFNSIGIERKKACLTEAEDAAYSYDKRVYKVDKPTYSESLLEKRFYNSAGTDISSRKTFYEIFLSTASKEGEDTGSGFDFDFSHNFSSLKFKKTAMNAAKKGVDQLGAKPVKSGKYKVVFDNYTASELLGILKQSFYASNVYKKKSLLDGKTGKKVFSDKIFIEDDGLLHGGAYTDLFDREGVRMQRKELCTAGVVNSFLFDIEYGKRFSSKSTGNSVSRSFSTPPDIGSTNFFVRNGNAMLIDVIGSIKDGLYINELMGLHMAKPYTGEFSLGASGYAIKNGKVDYPVKGIVISGNLMELFNSVAEIADDIRFFGSTGSPSILADGVQVSGT